MTDVSVLLLVATSSGATARSSLDEEKFVSHFDFFLLHLLNAAHAVRILMQHLPATCHAGLIEALFLVVMSYYIAELRPKIWTEYLTETTALRGTNNGQSQTDADVQPATPVEWEIMRLRCVEESTNGDPHFMKALRQLMEAEAMYGYKNGLYERAATALCDQMGES